MADLSLMESEYAAIERDFGLDDDIGLDDAMLPLQSVEKYAESTHSFNRQMVPHVLRAAFRSAPPDQLAKDLPHIMQIIYKIAEEDETTVRSDLLQQIPMLAETCVECSSRCPVLSTLIADHLLPLLVRNLTSTNCHLLKVAQDALLVLMERSLVTKVQAEIQVCPTVLSLSRKEQENGECIKDLGIDFQSSAVKLMSKLAPLLGRDVMERVFLQRFTELCTAETFNTRKLCATHIIDFAAVVGTDAYENVLLPSYLSLCSDENWSVRKACAEAAVSVSCVCPTASLRHCTLAPLYTRLLCDNSRWVRSAAFQGLGPFISTFAQQPGGVTTLSYNSQRELVLMNKYGCEFEVHSITPAIEDMKHFVNMSAMSGDSELDYSDGFSIPNLNQPSTSISDDFDSDTDDSSLGILDIDERTLCEYNRAVKMAESGQGKLRNGGKVGDAVGWIEVGVVRGEANPLPMSSFEGLLRQQLQTERDTINVQDNLVEHKSVENVIDADSTRVNEGQENISDPQNCPNLFRTNFKDSPRCQLYKAARRDYLATLQNSGDGNILRTSSFTVNQPQTISPLDSGNKIILFKGDVLATTIEKWQNDRQEHSDPSIHDSSSKTKDDLEQYNSYYYWYVSPDMPLDPDIVDAGIPLVAVRVTTQTPSPIPAAPTPDVVPQREPLPSPSMYNLNNEALSSSRSVLRNNGGNNICDLLSTTLNAINTEIIDINKEETLMNQQTNSISENSASIMDSITQSFETFNSNTLLLVDPPSNNPQLNTTFTINTHDKLLTTTGEIEVTAEDLTIEPLQRIVPQKLIEHYISMCRKQLEEDTNTDIAYYCAYSLPAVALTLGSENWHLLQSTLESLAQHTYYKVRLTVASSLHELAVILGQEIASDCLTIIFDGFIKDLDEVRIGILKHMAHFLILISVEKRRHYLGLFVEFLRIDNQLNWRFQLQLAIQLRLVVPLYRPLDVLRHIFSIGLVLLHHGVAVTRRTAITLVTEVFKYCHKKKKTTSNLLVKVAETLAHATLWKLRQTFALLAAELIRQEALPSPVFAAEVLPHLLDLSWDPVAVVRLSVGRTIATHIITKDYYKDPANQHHDTLQTVLRRLQSDKDRDVRDFSTLVSKENEAENEGTS